MKMEFLANGAEEHPLLRLFGFRSVEVAQLQQACRGLASGAITEFALHDQPWIEPISGCRFLWRAATKDVGVQLPMRGESFVLAFSEEGWLEVEGKLLPFVEDSRGFNWLTMEGHVRVLISCDGTW